MQMSHTDLMFRFNAEDFYPFPSLESRSSGVNSPYKRMELKSSRILHGLPFSISSVDLDKGSVGCHRIPPT